MATAPRIPLVIPRDGAKVLIVKFNDFQCPAVRPLVPDVQADPRQVRSRRRPGAVRDGAEGLSAQPDCNPRSSMVHPAACDAAVAVRLARAAQSRPADGRVVLHASAGDDARRRCVRRRGRSDRSPTSTRSTRATLELVKADVALGKQLDVHSTPTFFINGVKVEGRVGAAVLRSGDCVRAAAPARSVMTHSPQRTQGARRESLSAVSAWSAVDSDAHALATFELTKDYSVGFWRKRPYRALERLTLEVRERRGVRISRSERRRQDDDAEAADAAGLSDLRPRRDSGPAARRPVGQAARSATSRRIRTSTTI